MAKNGVYKWSAIDRIGNSVMTFTGNLILARLLDPSDFGLLAMVAIFSAIAYNVSQCGLSDGLIHKHNPTEVDYSTVFVFNGTLGLVFGILFIVGAEPLARFFGHHEIRNILWAIGICFFVSTLGFTQETRLRKELEIKKIAIVRLLATATSLVLGVILALTGFSYWGLVSMRVFLVFFTTVYYVIATRWIPRVMFSRASFRELFGYGSHLMLAYVVNQIGRNINTSVLGKVSTSAASGAYSQGQKIQEVPFGITEAIFNWPFFAVISKEENIERRRFLASEMHYNLWALNATVGLFLLLVSWPAFNFLYGSLWNLAIPVFRILVIYGIMNAMKYFYQTILKAYGKTKMIRNLSFLEVGLQLALLAVFFKKGILMIAWTQVIAVFFVLLIHAYWYKRLLGFRLRACLGEIFRALSCPALASAITGVIALIWYGRIGDFWSCLLFLTVFSAGMFGVCLVVRPAYLPLIMNCINKIIGRK